MVIILNYRITRFTIDSSQSLEPEIARRFGVSRDGCREWKRG